jgi:hypothetical protein
LIPAGRANALDDEERRLLNEIVKSAQFEIASEREKIAHGGTGDFNAINIAARRIMDAKLQLAMTPAEKVEVWAEFVKRTGEAVESARMMHEGGRGTIIDVTRVQTIHLEAQLGLYRAKKELSPQTTGSP